MTENWFDVAALEEMIAARGESLQLCRRVKTPGNPEYGISESYSYQCKPVLGHTQEKSASILGTNGSYVKTTELIAHILPQNGNFDPSQVNGSSYLLVQGIYYQMERTEIAKFMHQGQCLVYSYKLTQTDKSPNVY